jgi:hypothetical protein
MSLVQESRESTMKSLNIDVARSKIFSSKEIRSICWMQRIIFSSTTATTEIQEATFISFLFLYKNKTTGLEIDSENECQSSSMNLFLTDFWKCRQKLIVKELFLGQ